MLRIKVIRLSQGFSQFRLAVAMNMAQSRYCLLERGELPPTDIERRRLAEFLGAPASSLFRSVVVQGKVGAAGARAITTVG